MSRSIILLFSFLAILSTPVWSGEVNRAQFTTTIDNREPVDSLVSVPTDMKKVSFFTELLNFTDQKITHQWVYNDKEMYRLGFNVKGPRWRVWSSKRLLPKFHGSWTVNILNANDEVIDSKSFVYFP
ncbi:MAG: DUF2914 domain-containing protein [Gammaproteobacteria bacterium]|nr:DUF2914 domain-containing protein [Gammaproteobacteria bacterium]